MKSLDKENTIVILNPGGNSSAEERHLAKVKVAGSNPVSRFLCGGIAKWKGNGLQNRYTPVRVRVPPWKIKFIGGLVPNIKSAKKRVKIAEKKRKRNKGIKTQIKNIVRKLKEEKDSKKREELLKNAYSIVDKAVKKGVLHKNTAARKKSKLANLVKKK
jgi:small subunit ribosomal protein S20